MENPYKNLLGHINVKSRIHTILLDLINFVTQTSDQTRFNLICQTLKFYIIMVCNQRFYVLLFYFLLLF